MMIKRGLSALLAMVTAAGVVAGVATPEASAAAGDGRIAYTKNWEVRHQPGPDERSDIFTVRPDGSGNQRLTFTRNASKPKWSPGGRRIAFERPGEVWVMNADGSAKQRLTEGRLVDWMPTGGRVLVARGLGVDGEDPTWVLHSVGTGDEETLMIDLPLVAGLDDSYPDYSEWSYASQPALSPDGETLAVMLWRYDDDGSGYGYDFGSIFTVGLDGTGLSRIPKYTYSWGTPSWAPGGGQILYWGEEPRGYCVSGLRSLRLDGTPGPVDIQKRCASPHPTWSPDGKRILFTGGRSGTLQIASKDGSPNRDVIRQVDGVTRTQPDWRAGR